MKSNFTDITIVLDRSGSMESVKDDTIGGFNRFLKDQQAVPGEANLTLNQFDHEFETVLGGIPIRNANPLTAHTFVPRGSTALHDAIGRSINETGARLDKLPDHEKPEKVVFVILTDGYENASHEFSSNKIKSMVEHQKNTYNWEFVYLGANQDAIHVAGGIGIQASNAITYAANKVGTEKIFASASSNLASFRCSTADSMSFSEEDRESQRKAHTWSK